MKHIILGFVVLIFVPLFSRRWLHSFGRGFAVVLLVVAVGQVFIGVTKLGREDIQLSDVQRTVVLVVALVLAAIGSIWILRKPRNLKNI
jgi:hypothetical protein